jgi:hypothetical protein
MVSVARHGQRILGGSFFAKIKQLTQNNEQRHQQWSSSLVYKSITPNEFSYVLLNLIYNTQQLILIDRRSNNTVPFTSHLKQRLNEDATLSLIRSDKEKE